ncbi:hypothetical protein [Kitasatospora griseola]|uniref:hypothetical protein n=1 Tax=Kitasatospora griseola TaxID=2064 RepID=UPI0034227435
MPSLPILMSARSVARSLVAAALGRRRCNPQGTPATVPSNTAPPLPPLWFRREYEAVLVVVMEKRLHVARFWANGLIEESLQEFGEDHPFTRQAVELLGAVVRATLTDIDRNAPAAQR